MEKHTALPWVYDYGSVYSLSAPDGKIVATRNSNADIAPWEKDANLAYIAKACNAYPVLVEALERVENDCHKAANGGLTTASNKVTVKELTALLRDMRDYTRDVLTQVRGVRYEKS